MRAAGPGMWHGHLVSLVADEYLLDSTLDAISDEGHHQLVILSFGPLFWNMMSQDEDWHLIFRNL